MANPSIDGSLRWLDEAHGILDVLLDKKIQDDRPEAWAPLWDELLDACNPITMLSWEDANRLVRLVANYASKQYWRKQGSIRNWFHERLQALILNEIRLIQNSGYEQFGDRLWRYHAGEFRDMIKSTPATELDESIAKESVEDDASVDAMTFMRPDPSGNRGGNPAASRTTSRSDVYPYDRPVTYGRYSAWDNNAAGGVGDLTRPKNAWESLAEDLEAGDMGMGGLSPEDLELDGLKREFGRMFQDSLPIAQGMDSPSLFVLLSDVDPDFMAQTFAPEDDSEMADLYTAWGAHVLGPGEER